MVLLQRVHLEPSKESFVHPRELEQQARYRAYLFGSFRLFHKNVSIVEQMRRRSKTGTLLKWFLLNPGKLASADELLDLFWPDISAETALSNLHVTMHYLRHLLQPELKARNESRFIHRQSSNFYWFDMDEAWWADIVDVQKLFSTARALDQQGSDIKASFYYRKVIGYCNAGFLPEDASEEWLEPYRRRYNHIYSQALQQMMQICMRRAEFEEVMEYAYQALAVDPYCEPATKAIIDVHLQQGNVVAATRKLNDFCRFFQQTLGVEPGHHFQLLKERIRKTTR